ncbi:hypothetical protein [uncultured Luteimonas sp.]|uniref:hypothetical protein n=1 Tax=uncultured Luteimonas sp. TaxID=453144 RepID=UPI0026163FB6|nr:hypothetical protein [uncultured Luteimonas sp.]
MSEQHMHIEDAMESKFAKVGVRIFVGLAPFVAAAFAWFITSQLGDIKSMQAEQTTKLQGVTGDVQVLNAKLDSGVIWRITELERRVNTVEQAQKTP